MQGVRRWRSEKYILCPNASLKDEKERGVSLRPGDGLQAGSAQLAGSGQEPTERGLRSERGVEFHREVLAWCFTEHSTWELGPRPVAPPCLEWLLTSGTPPSRIHAPNLIWRLSGVSGVL